MSMKDINFVFFHVGEITYPSLLVKTIQKFHPTSKIYCVTDFKTEYIEGVFKTLRIDSNIKKLMTARLLGFSKLKLNEPAIYIDTDVLLTKKIPKKLFENHDVYLCSISHYKNVKFNNEHLRKLNLPEYFNKNIGDIYPFIACFTYTKDYKFWLDCYTVLKEMDKKYHFWYGDQEAIKRIHERNLYNIGYLEEKIVCNLPEYCTVIDESYSLHFRGPRKKDMIKFSNLILNDN